MEKSFEKGLERDVVIWWVEKERTFHAKSGTSAEARGSFQACKSQTENMWLLYFSWKFL